MVGLLVNTLPLRIKLNHNLTIEKYIKKVQASFSQIINFHSTSLSQIQAWSGVVRHLPLFDNILVFENYPVEEEKEQLLRF